MDSLHTEPVDIEPADPGSPWQAFRVDHPSRRSALLRRMLAGNAPVTVADGQRPLYRLPVWSMDLQRGSVSLVGQPAHLKRPLPEPPRALWGVCYLEQSKLQLELLRPHWHVGGGMCLLKATLPGAVFALHRRGATRLRLPAHDAPLVCVPLPPVGSEPVAMLAVNIHAGGCALWKPGPALALQAGMLLQAVEVQLDDSHILVARLLVQHVTHLKGDGAGMRAGCAWQAMAPAAQQTLDAWLARRQRHNGTLRIDLDAL